MLSVRLVVEAVCKRTFSTKDYCGLEVSLRVEHAGRLSAHHSLDCLVAFHAWRRKPIVEGLYDYVFGMVQIFSTRREGKPGDEAMGLARFLFMSCIAMMQEEVT